MIGNRPFAFSRRHLGSATLPAVLSTAAGVLFITGFLNFVRYLNAINAVEQAARIAARCVSPTDAECLTSQALSAVHDNEVHYRWYGIPQRKWVSKTAKRFRYSAQMFEDTWEASFTAYRIHRVIEPGLMWRSYTIPLKSFVLPLNSYEYRYARLRENIIEPGFSIRYSPKYALNFPAFDPDYEWSHYIDPIHQPSHTWNPRKQNTDGTFSDYPELAMPSQKISANMADREVRVFAFPSVAVAPLPRASELHQGENAQCLVGEKCAIANLTGGDDNWAAHAYLAVKLFGNFKNLSEDHNAKVSWFFSDKQGFSHAGLWVDTFPTGMDAGLIPDPTTLAPLPPNVRRYCLGAGDWRSLPKQSSTWYNLLLRGPMGAYAVHVYSPICRKSYQHGIEIPRGNSFRIWAVAQSDGAPVRADVEVRYYFDELEVREIEGGPPVRRELDCEIETQLRPEEHPPCPTPTKCNPAAALTLKRGAAVESCNFDPQRVRKEPVCPGRRSLRDDSFVFALSDEDISECGSPVTAAVCDPDWRPKKGNRVTAEGFCVARPERKVCEDWRDKMLLEQRITIDAFNNSPASIQSLCPLATEQIAESPCRIPDRMVVYRPNDEYGGAEVCPLADSVLQQSLERTAAALRWWPERTVPFRSLRLSDLSRAKAKGDRWLCSLDNDDDAGKPLSGEGVIEQIRPVFRNSRRIYSRRDPAWKPDLSYFSLQSLQECDLDFALRQQMAEVVSLSKESSQALSFTAGRPFGSEPQWQIPDFLPSVENEAHCSGPKADLEDRLRAYAARLDKTQSPLDDPLQALNKKLIFEVKDPVIIDEREISQYDECSNRANNSAQPPPCVPFREESGYVACAPYDFLGTFSNLEQPNGPPACQNGSYLECFREAEIAAVKDPQVDISSAIDQALARKKGFDEIRRVFPALRTDCVEADCAAIDISIDQNEAVRIDVRYEMPLSFPFDLLLARESIPVAVTNSDYLELAGAGRQ